MEAMKLFKRLVLIVVSLLVIVLIGIITYAATPLSNCQFPSKVSNVSSTGLGQSSGKSMDHVKYVEASDHTRLAYREYIPDKPKAIVIFYHGSGANSAAGYQPIGEDLSTKYHIATYLPDIRGHGLSAGKRGDTPSVEQMYEDVTTMIAAAHEQFPSTPVFLGGHSAGAGLIVNYINSPSHEFVDGYLFVSPDFGLKSKTMYEGNGGFATVCTRAYVINALSGGWLKGHAVGVRYNYSDEQLKSDIGLVQDNSVNMSLALNPSKPDKEVAQIDRHFGLWVGAEDEIMNPQKVTAFASLAKEVSKQSLIQIVPGEKHLGILNDTGNLIGPWVL
jgi:acylglycerol lipase